CSDWQSITGAATAPGVRPPPSAWPRWPRPPPAPAACCCCSP
ncbi:MAG: hypothetical protein AVDCRST_MAG13-2573, partial [uncultured Solirubrobacteraceae bacterium]